MGAVSAENEKFSSWVWGVGGEDQLGAENPLSKMVSTQSILGFALWGFWRFVYT
jgi:hypothetical protein